MMMMTMMNVYDDYDYDDDDFDDYYDYHEDDYDDYFHYDDEDSDYGMLGSMVQMFDVATNTAACTLASTADPRGSATNPRCPTPANTPRIVYCSLRLPPLPPTRRLPDA